MESRLDGGNDISANGELLVQNILLRYPPSGRAAIVFDVGANVGAWSQYLLDRADSSKLQIHGFEPASSTFAALCVNLKSQNNVVFANQALSNNVGSAEFFVVGAGLGTNSLHQSSPTIASKELVVLNTVDHYSHEAGISHIDLLKIDAEGYDMAVIEGARAMIQSHSISLLQFEYNQRWIYSRHYLKDAFDLLQPFGYKIGKITGNGIEFYPDWDFELESFREGNYLACLDEWIARFPKIKWWNLA
jgi:FkbM family methyltransferase